MDDPGPAPLPQEEDNEASGGRFFFLFMFLLVDIVLYPYAGDRGLRFQLFRSISFFVTLASVYAVSFRRSTWIIARPLASRADNGKRGQQVGPGRATR